MDKFIQDFVREVVVYKRHIEVTFNVFFLFNLSHKKENTYIGGLSMGGYGAIRNGLKYSETFNENHNFRDFLASENYDFIYEESSAVHNWKFWNEHIKKAFEWIDNN